MAKTYVVTGATSGIGRKLVELISDDNLVFAAYRTDSMREELFSVSDNVIPFYLDYSKPETVAEAVNFIKTNCEKVDTLVNVAGCVVAGPVEKLSIHDIRQQFDVNVFGHIELAQGLADIMNNGKIINISSMASFGLFPFISPYCASKRCLDMFFNSFLIENKRNIKVVSIKPGVIVTPLWAKSIEKNIKNVDIASGYEKEMQFILNNAKKNETSGLEVQKVVDLIVKIDSLKNPKLSYTIGKDAKFAQILSFLPQNIINKIVKLGLRIRMGK